MSETTTGPASQGSTGPIGRRVKWLLIASLAANLLLVGTLAGPYFFGRKHMRGSERAGEEFGLMGYTRHLPAERRKLIRKIVEAERPTLKALRDDVRKARQEAGAVLVAEPFDGDKLKAAVGRIGEAEAKLKDTGLSTFLTAAGQLSLEERQGLLEHWKKRRPRHFWNESDDKGPPPPPKD